MALRMTLPNLARDPDIVELVQRELLSTIMSVRDNRVRLEERWQRFYRIWNCEMDKNSYSGRSKIFLPAARATCETWVNAISRDLFPSTSDWYAVNSIENIGDDIRADSLKSLFDYFFTRQQKLKSDIGPGLRQLVIYGTSPFKMIYENEEDEIFALQRKVVNGEEKYVRGTKKVKRCYGPTVLPRDLFNVYVWPETAKDVQDADIVFEDIEVTLGHIRQMAKTPMDAKKLDLGMVYEVPDEVFLDIGQSSGHNDLYRHRRQRLQRMGLSSDPSDRWNKLTVNRRNLTELYKKMDVGEGEKEYLLTLVNDFWVVRIQENPYWHKKKPFFIPRLIRCVGEFYGRGVMEVIDRIQYMMNDIVNQSLDSVQFELNPIMVIDPGRVAFPNSIRVHPGAKWLAEPDGVLPIKPQSVAAIGFSTLSMLQGFIQDFSGANATMQGQPAVRGRGRSQNTASGMSMMLQQGSSGIGQVIEDLEQQLGEPILAMAYQMLEQFMEEKILLRILGRRGVPLLQKEVGIEDVVGDYEFKWLGSVAQRNRQVLGQQMINFLNIARGLPPPVLEKINWQWLAQKIWTEGLGLRDAQELFSPQGFQFSVDPILELKLVKESREIAVSPGDDHQAHLKQHFTDRAEITDPGQLEKWDKHIQDHLAKIAQMVAEQQKQQQMQQMAEMAQAMEMQQKMMGPGRGQNGGKAQTGARPQNQPGGGQENELAAIMQQLQGAGGGEST